jgi:two-component system chemotaxis response regulator CheB
LIGASAGGVNAILALAQALPRDFRAPILFVQHIGAHRSELWKLVSARGPNVAVNARDGDVPRPGTIHILAVIKELRSVYTSQRFEFRML